MKIAFGVDPGGWPLHDGILEHLKECGHEVIDLGTTDMETNVVPYMYVGKAVAEAVTSKKADFGIVACGTGMGISIATNKNKGARCALCESWYTARESRIINNANILALGGTLITQRMANDMIDVFLATEWGEGLPEFRVERIKNGDANFKKYEDEQFG